MKKVINPCKCETYNSNGSIVMSNAFVKIEFKNGRLSLCGVIGPMSNGDCRGSAGQCLDQIRSGTPVGEWTQEMIQKLCDIWDEWHLNDMKADCEHQRADKEFQKQKNETVIVYKWLHLPDEVSKEKKSVSEYIKKELSEKGTVTLTERQRFLYNVQDCIYNHVGNYDTNLYYHKDDDIEHKALNWITPEQHERGLLGKPCPVCGYEYGHGWQKVEVPQDVIDWLFSLPDTTVRPAWV